MTLRKHKGVDMPRHYREPTAAEQKKLDESREVMKRGISGEDDFLSRIAPTMRKAAKDDMRLAARMRESVPAAAREGEAYKYAGYKKGGSVKSSASKRADGIAQRGKTKGRML